MYFPSGSTIEPASTKEEVDAAFVIYPQLGLEFTAYFGDFKPLKGNKKRRNRRKKRGGRR